MRWSIIRLIWVRELRDQLRDRRTLFMIAGLPLLLYPLLGFAVAQFAAGLVSKPSTIGVVAPSGDGHGTFPARPPTGGVPSPAVPAASWLALAPAVGPGLRIDQIV